jgi:hypothetical protein
VTSLGSVQTMLAITAGGTAHPGEGGRASAAFSNLKSLPHHGEQMISPFSASALTARYTGNIGTAVLGLGGLVSAVSSPASRPLFPGNRDELMCVALGPMGACIINTMMEGGLRTGRLWVAFSFLLLRLCL